MYSNLREEVGGTWAASEIVYKILDVLNQYAEENGEGAINDSFQAVFEDEQTEGNAAMALVEIIEIMNYYSEMFEA